MAHGKITIWAFRSAWMYNYHLLFANISMYVIEWELVEQIDSTFMNGCVWISY